MRRWSQSVLNQEKMVLCRFVHRLPASCAAGGGEEVQVQAARDMVEERTLDKSEG